MTKRTLSVGIVIYKGNKVLLVKHTESARLPTGAYGFPAGRVEENEEPIEAAIRELEEETGLKTSREYLHQTPERRNKLKMQEGFEDFVFIPFVCTKYSGELKPSDKTIPEFIELSELENISLIAEDVKTISREFHNHYQ